MLFGEITMIKYLKGTVFNSNAKAIVNTVNCDGFMGAGLAHEYKLRYPDLYEKYKNDIENGLVKIGKVNFHKIKNDLIIINFPTKNNFKYPSRLSWIEEGLLDFCSTYKSNDITSIAFPKLGTSNGGLDWNEVKKIMERYLSELDIEVYVCLDENQQAEGIEKIMVDNFNNCNLTELLDKIRINERQLSILTQARPINRFYEIKNLESIGLKTYEKLFDNFYRINEKNQETNQQLKLF